MTTEDSIKNLVQELSGKGKTYAEFIAQLFKDKFVEIYLGDAYETVSTEQISSAYPAVFCGRVVGAFRECIILNSIYVNKAKEAQLGNFLFINERAIRALTEIDNSGTIEEMFLRSKECNHIKDLFDKKS